MSDDQGEFHIKNWAIGKGEVRVTSDTGGQKGSKKARFDLIPVVPLWEVAEVYGKGAEKYEDRNWERGYDWSLSFAALRRHARSEERRGGKDVHMRCVRHDSE